MASEAQPTGSNRQDLFEAFHRALGHLRRGVHTDRLAERLLGRDQAAEVVALIDGGERAVVFDESERQIVAEQFDAHGFGESEVLWERASDPAAWLDAHRDEVAWVRAEYERALEMDGEQSEWRYWMMETHCPNQEGP